MEGEPSIVGRSMMSLKVNIFLRSSTIRMKFPVHLGELLVLGLLASLIDTFLMMLKGEEFEEARLDEVRVLEDNIDLDDLIGMGVEEGLGEDEDLGDEEDLTSCLLILLTLGDD